ncbi:MAG: hypothetical protein HP497_10640 [Nitrospira sp.]|nr:hypothetical protein [Nitrospira sp.]
MARTGGRLVITAACLWSLSTVPTVQPEAAESGGVVRLSGETSQGPYRSDQYWIGTGQGDLSKGHVVCQRVAELAARADLAKQIRVLIKEHLVDRTRERTGKEVDQQIELTREEIVQEYLQDVKIVDRRIDEEHKTCAATAVMPRDQVPQKPDPAIPDLISPGIR